MFNAFIISTIAGLSTVIGALFIFLPIKEKNINKIITFSLALSTSIMIGISVTELIPESFFYTLNIFGITKGQYIILFIMLSGYFLITIINKLIKNNHNLYKIGILSMITLIIHNFPEGIATFMASYKDLPLGIKLSVSIMLHNVPEGLTIAVPIYYATRSKIKGLKYALLSGLAEPIGALMAYIFLKNYITNTILNLILLFVAALMITLSIKELFPKALKYKENKLLNIGLLIGLFIVIINFIN